MENSYFWLFEKYAQRWNIFIDIIKIVNFLRLWINFI